MKLSQVLKHEREKKHYSMRQLCKITAIPISGYHGWENGAAPVFNCKTYNYLKRIKIHYSISWEYMFEGSDPSLNLEKASLFLSEYIKAQNDQRVERGGSGG